jgi:hypothetical protein
MKLDDKDRKMIGASDKETMTPVDSIMIQPYQCK